MVTHPKESATQAAQESYNTNNRVSAASVATELLHTPKVKLELAKYSSMAESTVLEVMNYSKEYGAEGGKDGAAYAGVAIAAAKDILDRVHGKATQRTENLNVAVQLNVNLAD